MVIILMGVCGSGKTTIGTRLSKKLGFTFVEGDEFHPSGNLEKMANGVSLTDQDRYPWLTSLREHIQGLLDSNESAVVTCSALRENYRQILFPATGPVVLVYLKGDFDLMRKRLVERENHFMRPSMLQTQFDPLEEPKHAIVVDVDCSPSQVVERIVAAL